MPILRFTRKFVEHSVTLFTEAERLALIEHVSANPETGDVVAGTGGVRKLRWGMAGQGKRGGARACIFFYGIRIRYGCSTFTRNAKNRI